MSPSSSDSTDRSGTMPRPELNPLINPVLGQNMGRWAEVYFNSPPEKREEAVAQLLQELQAESSTREDDEESDHPSTEHRSIDLSMSSNEETSASSDEEASAPPPGDVSTKDLPEPAACLACGHPNPEHQRFCGMCGANLPEQQRPSKWRTKTIEQTELSSSIQDQDLSRFLSEHGVESWSLTTGDDLPASSAREVRSGPSAMDGIFRSSYPSSPPYRFYVGIVLALLIAGLVYVAWRSGLTTSGDTRITPSPGTAKAEVEDRTKPASTPTTSPDREASTSDKTATPPLPTATTPSVPTVTPPPSTELAPKTPAPNQPTHVTPPSPTAPEPENQPLEATPVAAPGSEEVAIAQSYLNHGNGHRRDAQEAVRWLWKAVAKRNPEATLQLADLYLEGDGIPKNCDQARVLLRVAAAKGSGAAAERLRHLQSFGCE